MSCRRSVLSLCGTHSLAENPLAELWLAGIASHEVHWPPQQFLQPAPQASELKKRHGHVEVDQ